jgi:hypothetical protein
LIAAQFLSVVLVQTQRCDDQFLGTWNRKASIPARWPSAESVKTSAHQFSPIDCSDATTTAVDRLTRSASRSASALRRDVASLHRARAIIVRR